jgi:hypothetical protein
MESQNLSFDYFSNEDNIGNSLVQSRNLNEVVTLAVEELNDVPDDTSHVCFCGNFDEIFAFFLFSGSS